MRRRKFITLMGAAAASWPLAVSAQQASKRVYRLGYLAPARITHLLDALFSALRDLGYVEGQNLKVEYRYGAGKELDELAGELAKGKPDLIVTVATPPALAAKRATTTIPIVMATAGDPVSLGVVASLARPGGNVTGVTLYGSELNAKRIELFREAVPTIKRLAFLAKRKECLQPFSVGGGGACGAVVWFATPTLRLAAIERPSGNIFGYRTQASRRAHCFIGRIVQQRAPSNHCFGCRTSPAGNVRSTGVC